MELPASLEVDTFLAEVEDRLKNRCKPTCASLKVGLDLGTATVVLVVLDGEGHPLGTAQRTARVIRDGLVVDFVAARDIAKELRLELEEALGFGLTRTAIAVPPGTSDRDTSTHRYVAESAGLEVVAVWDEPVAANLLLGLKKGAIADIGGGTTGVAVLSDGQVIHSFDEATGGTHLSLVLAGRFKMDFEKAELFKVDPAKINQVAPAVAPVLEKIGSIIRNGLVGYEVKELYLVGGTAASPGIGSIVGRETGLSVRVLERPWLVTPAGIALGCEAFPAESHILG